MRDRVWNTLVNVKFKALYTNECSVKADSYGRLYSFFLAFASASSVAAWSVWDSYPFVWATIVGVSQIMHVAKPYIPFIKNDREFLKMSASFEKLYLDLERLWYAIESEKIEHESAENTFYSFREKIVSIEHDGVNCPEVSKWVNKITDKTDHSLSIQFAYGESNA